jgi:hypothetical protein
MTAPNAGQPARCKPLDPPAPVLERWNRHEAAQHTSDVREGASRDEPGPGDAGDAGE